MTHCLRISLCSSLPCTFFFILSLYHFPSFFRLIFLPSVLTYLLFYIISPVDLSKQALSIPAHFYPNIHNSPVYPRDTNTRMRTSSGAGKSYLGTRIAVHSARSSVEMCVGARSAGSRQPGNRSPVLQCHTRAGTALPAVARLAPIIPCTARLAPQLSPTILQ